MWKDQDECVWAFLLKKVEVKKIKNKKYPHCHSVLMLKNFVTIFNSRFTMNSKFTEFTCSCILFCVLFKPPTARWQHHYLFSDIIITTYCNILGCNFCIAARTISPDSCQYTDLPWSKLIRLFEPAFSNYCFRLQRYHSEEEELFHSTFTSFLIWRFFLFFFFKPWTTMKDNRSAEVETWLKQSGGGKETFLYCAISHRTHRICFYSSVRLK